MDNLSQYEEQLFGLLTSPDLDNVKVACAILCEADDELKHQMLVKLQEAAIAPYNKIVRGHTHLGLWESWLYDTEDMTEGLGCSIVIDNFRCIFNTPLGPNRTIDQSSIENYLFRIFTFPSQYYRAEFEAYGIDTLNIWAYLITDVKELKDGKRK